MRTKTVAATICLLGLLVIIGIAIHSGGDHKKAENQPQIAAPVSTVPVPPTQTTNLAQLHQVLNDYGSTNSDARMTSILVRQLIAEQLLANEAFLEWGTNVARSAILKFFSGNVPVYGISTVTSDDITIERIKVFAKSGLHADAHCHGLQITVDGGINQMVTMVKNSYKMEEYQLEPSHRRERTDWSRATAPLEKNLVDRMARDAFAQMTARSLDEFNVTPDIQTPEIPNLDARRPDVQVTGMPGANLISSDDKVYPFAEFSYHVQGSSYRPFSGQMLQTSAGRGEFVELFAPVGSPDAMFSLAQKFLAPQSENWEQNLLTEVRSMDTEQRGQVYRRVFQH